VRLGNRSYLNTPMGSFESNNNLPPGWFFIFTREDIRVGYTRDSHPEGDRWTWPENREDGEERGHFACSTTAAGALETLRRKEAMVVSPYIKGLLCGLDMLRGWLEKSPPGGAVELDIHEWLWFYSTVMEGSDDFFKLLEMLDSSLASADPAGFMAFFSDTAGVELKGSLQADLDGLMANDCTLAGWFLGADWPAEDQKKDEEE